MNYVCKELFNFKIDFKDKKKNKSYQNNKRKMKNYKLLDRDKLWKSKINL